MPRITVNVKSLVDDIRAGMGRSDLTAKHGLSVRALQGIVTHLLDSGTVSRDELYGDLRQHGDTIFPDSIRCQTRCDVDFETIVYEASRPHIQGKVRDITEDGVGVLGLQADVDQIRTLVILGDALGEVETFEFEAKCRWIDRDGASSVFASGFQIVKISERDLTELRKFVRLVTFAD
jgi:hypothetical protein